MGVSRAAPRALLLALVALVFERDAVSSSGARVRHLLAGEEPRALRVFARAGDAVLENAEVTAVVRASDGALVDFLRRRAVLPTSEQLGTTLDIDGVWDLGAAGLLRDGNVLAPQSASVTVHAGAVVVDATLLHGGARITARVRYTLDATRPTLRIAANFRSDAELKPDVGLGLAVRWGNLSYFVEGRADPLLSYAGIVGWAGRQGAGGDLLLRAAVPGRFNAFFKSRPGSQAPLFALAATGPEPYRDLSATYELSYEPLPLPPPSGKEPDRGRLEVQVADEAGRPLAAKVMFLPEDNPRRPSFAADGGLHGADRFAWTGNGALSAAPPAGRYELLVSAGPERAVHRQRVHLRAGATQRVAAVLARVVPTPGWIAADLHLHQAPSVDADVSVAQRLVAVAAEGVELAVATDHYVVTDYAPSVAELVREGVLVRPLLTVVGSEVSTIGQRFGHFNVFPLLQGDSIEYADTTPSRLFASARRASPSGVLQVNHPRLDSRLGYFTHYELDVDTGVPKRPGFDPNFDLLEVYNGTEAEDLARVERVLYDYLHLLRGGRRYVATGSSDSHKLAFLDPGVPRTLIAHGAALRDSEDAKASIVDVLSALKAGRAIVTSGPFIEARVAGAGPGETAYAVGERSELEVRVLAPRWMDVRRVRVLQGPEGQVVHDSRVDASGALVRLSRKVALRHERATFVVVTATGDEPLPNTGTDSIRPFAFTNPIWIAP